MTAQQTMNKTQKDNEHCLNIQARHHRMGRAKKKKKQIKENPCFIVDVLSHEWTCLGQ